ncbi:hypothetical protein [Streptomyces iconiensis]|uniref:Uncharacterized protein n=1 Tax=Streptomyces iconiensis TaxID=1384038 RepID=A0ABT6ZSX2_9ACTN|nr:hypothetical protein [Streptomyces iconiensis]MDJ1132168.1 hypothetical protein [Streptomyces iconiensis]
MHQGAAENGSRPFTLVVCTTCRTAAEERALERLRVAVRSCPHGVLVTGGCLRLFLSCSSARGFYAVVQPCTKDREPSGPLVRIGPVRGAADAEAVCLWLRTGMPGDADGSLPARLRARRSARTGAHPN